MAGFSATRERRRGGGWGSAWNKQAEEMPRTEFVAVGQALPSIWPHGG